MSTVSNILEKARQRASESALAYSGAVTPDEAWALLQGVPGTKIVDVRTHAEWQFVGTVPNALLIEWKRYPEMAPNPEFLTQLKTQVDPQNVVLFLCRSGARSHDAAVLAAKHGYTEAYNILEGFEGDKDEHQHRGQKNGWKGHKLPWTQG